MRIEAANEALAMQTLPQLNSLLINAVDSGASIGYWPPMSPAAAEAYWQGRIAALSQGACVLLLAWEEDTLTGTAQLALEGRPNGMHRAEVQKVLVHTDYRRRGIGRQLMLAIEACALQNERSLLFLDTRQGDAAETLYRQMGFIEVGKIPNYVRSETGVLEATVVYYKILS